MAMADDIKNITSDSEGGAAPAETASAGAARLMPRQTTGLDIAFGPSNIMEWMPPYKELPEEFRRERTTWASFVSGWFYRGLANVDRLKAKPDIVATQALNHVKAVLGSWDPKHEHKMAGCAYLLSLWFEPITQEDVDSMLQARRPQ
jgi:hypothetical protein